MITERRLEKRQGVEGPRHDPYGFDEYTVVTNGLEVTIHLGLDVWLRVGMDLYRNTPDRLIRKFEDLTGIPVERFMDYYDRVHPYFDDPMGHPSQYI